MKKVFLLLSIFSSFLYSLETSYPMHPDDRLTPGHLCDTPDAYRYPEKIPYCSRNVSGQTKVQVIREYDERLGFEISKMNRQDFKIDHYIPLCMGGSNKSDNLWPQHKSVYLYTDPIEQKLCEQMAAGKLLQNEAVDIIKRAKECKESAQTVLKTLGL